MQTFNNDLMLPWTNERSESRRFKLILSALFAFTLVFAIWIPMVDLPEKEREELEKLPPQLAKIIKDTPKPVKPIPPKVEKPKPEDKPKPEEKPKPEKKPKPEDKPKPKPVKKPASQAKLVKEAREVAKKTGLVALQSELASLRDSLDLSSLNAKPAAKQANQKAAKASAIDTQKVLSRSGGVSDSSVAAPVQGVALNSLASETLDETADERALAIAEAEAALGERERSEESIRLGIEKLKSSLYALYNRELRKDPFLEGRVVLEVVIESSGEVSYCRVVSSELNHKSLESKIVSRMKLHNFGAENVARTTREIPFDFQPK